MDGREAELLLFILQIILRLCLEWRGGGNVSCFSLFLYAL